MFILQLSLPLECYFPSLGPSAGLSPAGANALLGAHLGTVMRPALLAHGIMFVYCIHKAQLYEFVNIQLLTYINSSFIWLILIPIRQAHTHSREYIIFRIYDKAAMIPKCRQDPTDLTAAFSRAMASPGAWPQGGLRHSEDLFPFGAVPNYLKLGGLNSNILIIAVTSQGTSRVVFLLEILGHK